MAKQKPQSPDRAIRLASYVIIAILALLPFHALLTTWAGSNFGHLDAWRIAKELLMVPLGLYAAWLAFKNQRLRSEMRTSWLLWAIVAYTAVFFIEAAVVLVNHSVNTNAILYSLITNLRFIWFMLVVWVIGSFDPLIRRNWVKIVLLPASLAIGFGMLQKFLLPADFLRHFGYGPNTINPIETVDQKLNYRRIQSSLRGANPLGAYLILVLTTAVAYVRKQKWLWLLLSAGLVVLFFSYSRSAWLGLVVSLVTLAWLTIKDRRVQRLVLVGVIGVMLVGAGLTWLLRNNNTVQNSLFHSDETSRSSLSSNSLRTEALHEGVVDVTHQPWGQGPGTAGPASVRNNGEARIAENYFLQIGQEVGWLGLALFITINVLVAGALWRRSSPLSRVLLASLVGLTLVNMVSHAWADETISLLWWGLAGVALSSPVILDKD